MSRHRKSKERLAKHPLEPSWGEIAMACAIPAVVVGVALVAGAAPGWVIAGLSGLCAILAMLVLAMRRALRRAPATKVTVTAGPSTVRFASGTEVESFLAEELPRWQPLLNRLEADERADRAEPPVYGGPPARRFVDVVLEGGPSAGKRLRVLGDMEQIRIHGPGLTTGPGWYQATQTTCSHPDAVSDSDDRAFRVFRWEAPELAR